MNKTGEFNIRLESVDQDDVAFNCGIDERIFEAAKRQGIFMANYCKQGACGACASRLVAGSVSYIRSIKGAPQNPVPGDEVRPCSLKPYSDVVLAPLSAWQLAGD